MGKILVIGSLNMDFVVDAGKMPIAGETILGKSVSLVPGGKGANQAYAIGKLGGNVKMIGAVGDDDFGKMLLKNLKDVDVDISGIEILKESSTGNAFITLDDKGENSIVVVPGANGMLSKEIIDKHIEMINECDTIIMQLEIPLDVVEYVSRIAHEKGKKVILDPAPAICSPPKSFYENLNLVKPNETELQTLLGKTLNTEEELIEGGKELLENGIETVILTLGSKGAVLIRKGECEKFSINKVDVVDTTAAGDSFTAALATALERGLDYSKAIHFANLVAGIVVTRKGAQTSIPSLEEIENSGSVPWK